MFSGGTRLATVPLGEPYFAPEGDDRIVLNDTFFDTQIVREETRTVYAGRLDVTDVGGTFTIMATAGDSTHGGHVLDATLPTGTDITVLPGHYTVRVTYLGTTALFAADVPNAP